MNVRLLGTQVVGKASLDIEITVPHPVAPGAECPEEEDSVVCDTPPEVFWNATTQGTVTVNEIIEPSGLEDFFASTRANLDPQSSELTFQAIAVGFCAPDGGVVQQGVDEEGQPTTIVVFDQQTTSDTGTPIGGTILDGTDQLYPQWEIVEASFNDEFLFYELQVYGFYANVYISGSIPQTNDYIIIRATMPDGVEFADGETQKELRLDFESFT